MATNSSTLAWKIPLTEMPGGLQTIGLQRVGHNWTTLFSHTVALTKGLCCQSSVSAFFFFFLCCLGCHNFSAKKPASFKFMAAVTIHSDFGAQENKVCHRFHCFPIYLPWNAGAKCHDLPFIECWVLSQPVHSPLSLSSRASLVPLHFLPWGWCHLLFWGYW